MVAKIEKKPMSPATAIIIAGVLVAGAVLLSGYMRMQGGSTSGPKVALASAPEYKIKAVDTAGSNEWRLGPKDAPVTIVEFTDTECPFCKKSHSIIHDVIDHYDGKVALVFKHFPLESLHALARNESKALECAGMLGGNVAFWDFTDTVFTNTKSNDGLDPTLLPAIAKKIGLNEKKFVSCLAENNFDDRINSDQTEGEALKVQGTPFFAIYKDGKKVDEIPGAYPLSEFTKKIDPLLK